MRRKAIFLLWIMLFLGFESKMLANQIKESKPVRTNKEKVLTLAVQGRIAPARPDRSFSVTWDGKPKLAIGIGGINYNLKIGEKVFGWASGDRATVGVAAEGTDEDRRNSAWLTYTSIGNEAIVLSGHASREKGVIIGKFGDFVLVHFDDAVLEKLAISDILQVKARGIGVEIEGFPDVFVHGLAPEVLEKLGIMDIGGKLVVPVVKEIPADIIGQGAGGSSLAGNWHIQTCYPPDIKKYGLEDLRFGDLVLLKDVQTDYGKGYYKGGATVGVICSGPSEISGLGIGVTPILSTRFGKLIARIDPASNIGKYLGLKMNTGKDPERPISSSLKTNAAELIMTAVQGVVLPPEGGGYTTGYDGKPVQDIGMGSINYTVSLGDSAYGWANADHVEPDVTFQGRERQSSWDCALAILACIGNEAEVISGEATGAKGLYIGRHAGSDDLVWLPKEAVEKLALNDQIQVKARGVGLKIDGFEDVKVNKLSPELLERIGITVEDGQLVVPVVMEVPGYIMGSGMGYPVIEALDYDVQTTCPEAVEEFGLKKLRLGDLVAIRDHYDVYAPGRYQGAVTIGIVIHGFSSESGHGPGMNPVLSGLPGRIKTRLDPNANTAYYLGIKPIPSS